MEEILELFKKMRISPGKDDRCVQIDRFTKLFGTFNSTFITQPKESELTFLG